MPTPAPQDFNQQIGDINATFAANAPGVGAGVISNATNLVRGNFDAQQFFNAHPGAQQEWEANRAAGEMQGWTPAQFAASYIGGSENDPRLNQYYTGGLGQAMGQAAQEAQGYINQANTSARQATVDDFKNMGGAAVDAFYGANPGLASAAGAISGSIGGLNLGAQNISPVTFNPIGAQPGGVGATGPFPASNGGSTGAVGPSFMPMSDYNGGLPPSAAPGWAQSGPSVGGNFGPTPQPASFGGGQSMSGPGAVGVPGGQPLGYQQGAFGGQRGEQGGYVAQNYTAPQFQAPTDNFSNAFMGQANNFSSLALSPIQQMLQQQALGDLRLGGSLSGQDIRSAQQSARAGQSARGLAMGKNAVGEEILQTDALSRARLNERRGFASAVDANAFSQQNANRQLGLGYAGLANSSQQAAQQLGLGYNQLNGQMGLGYAQLGQNDRQFGAQLNQQNKQFGQTMGFNYAQLGQQDRQFGQSLGQNRDQFNAANNLAAQQFNADLALRQQAGDRGYALNSTQMLGNLNSAALGMLNANGTGYNQANVNYANAAAASPSYNSFLNYGQNVFDNNNNAAWGNYNASQNRNAALWGGLLGAGGSILGGAFGGALTKKLFG